MGHDLPRRRSARWATIVRRRWRAWTALDLRDKVELVWLAALALGAEVAVRALPLPLVARALGISLARDGSDVAAPDASRALDDETRRRAAAVDRLYRAWPRKDSCLRRALVLGYRVRARHPALLIGVASENGAVRAHAWIEVDGVVVGTQAGTWAPLRAHSSA